MIIYGYKCPKCSQTYTSYERADRIEESCQVCNYSPLHRDFSGLAVHRPMQEHWNKTVDRPISSQRQFNAALREESDRLSRYTGVEQDLQPIDPEQARMGVTEEGLESTNRVRVKRGMNPIKL